jgi:hypothetical protein
MALMLWLDGMMMMMMTRAVTLAHQLNRMNYFSKQLQRHLLH